MKDIVDLGFSRNTNWQRPEGSEPSPCVFSGLMCLENYRGAWARSREKIRRLPPPGGRSCRIGQGRNGRGAVVFRMHGEGRNNRVCGCPACGWERKQLKELCCHELRWERWGKNGWKKDRRKIGNSIYPVSHRG